MTYWTGRIVLCVIAGLLAAFVVAVMTSRIFGERSDFAAGWLARWAFELVWSATEREKAQP